MESATGGEISCGSTGEYIPSEDRPVHLTPSAISAVRDAIKAEGQEGDGLRVAVIGGGCSGYQYNLDFDQEVRMGDLELDFDGVKILVDQVSAGLLNGTVIDYVSGLNGTGFKFNNPNANRTCGCGSSFG
jgi:iron-sulfur cluster assembly accessory protein